MDLAVKSFPNDLQIVFVAASSFPEGIQPAFDMLESKLRQINHVSYFGVSNPEPGKGIVYRAAATTMPAIDAAESGLDTMTIKGGQYYSIRLDDVHSDPQLLTEVFAKILAQPDIDPQGHCIEVYDHLGSAGVECIVRKNETGITTWTTK